MEIYIITVRHDAIEKSDWICYKREEIYRLFDNYLKWIYWPLRN